MDTLNQTPQEKLSYETPKIEVIELQEPLQLLAQSTPASRGNYQKKQW
ncbi:MAG: hypothetical protein IKQ70_06205 [Bacteroidales bacterium]|nr:hypothetical protein [Bacteroidales bacterium]